MDRLTGFKLGMGVSITADNDWRDVGRPQVAMHLFYFAYCLRRCNDVTDAERLPGDRR